MEFNQEFFATVGFTIINILVLYIILKKVLFKPVTKHMDDRTKKIEDALKMAEEAKRKVEELQIEYDAKLKEAKQEGQLIVEDHKKMAEKAYETIIASAKKEADIIIKNTKNELEIEKQEMISKLKNEMADLVLATTEKVLQQNVDDKANRKLISNFINKS